jgi:hypothetical protein
MASSSSSNVSPVELIKVVVVVSWCIVAVAIGIYLADDPIHVSYLLICLGFFAVLLLSKDLCTRFPLWIWSLPWLIPFGHFDFTLRELVVPTCFLIWCGRNILKIREPGTLNPRLPGAYWIFAGWLTVLILQAMAVGGFGLRLFGSSKMGGRTFIPFIIALLIFPILWKGGASSRRFYWSLLFYLLLGGFSIALGICIDSIFPSIGRSQLGHLFGIGGEITTMGDPDFDYLAPKRYQGLSFLGVACFAVGYFNLRSRNAVLPLILRAVLCLLGVGLAMLSGHRIAILNIIGFVLVNEFFQSKRRFWLATFFSILMLGLIILGQGTVFNLPATMQRSLAFLPGKWDFMATASAKSSNEWRIKIWEEAMPLIRENLWFGRGLTFDPSDVYATINQGQVDSVFVVTNTLHNGPLSMMFAFGVHGLLFALILSGYICFRAIQIRRKYASRQGSLEYDFIRWISTEILISTFIFFLVSGGHNIFAAQAFIVWGILEVLNRIAVRNSEFS